jgi:TrmH family RNA methyltransferase
VVDVSGDPVRPGQVLSITSLANPRIKAIRALALPKHRREAGQFMAEGLKLAADALEAGWPIRVLLHGAEVAGQPMVQKVAATARARGADIIAVNAPVLARLTRRDNPQMVVGVYDQRLTPPEEVKPGRSGVWVALEAIRDPGNLGTIVRTADSVGADGVILVGDSVDPFGIEAVRATMGSIFHVPLARMGTDRFLAWRRTWPGTVVGTHLGATEDYRAGPYKLPTLLLMGNEQSGLTAKLAEACDRLVRIPQAGKADSLNLAVATGVMLYEIRRPDLHLGPT